MHSMTCKNGTTFHFDGDYSGEIIICTEDYGHDIRINAEDLMEFATSAVAWKIIETIEEKFC